MCPKCKEAGDLVTDLRVVTSETARQSITQQIKDLHAACSFVGCTCQHKLPEIKDGD
jgi:hypothetical protein